MELETQDERRILVQYTFMEFDYKALGDALVWNRKQKNMRQIDVEIRSGYKLKQPAISSMERGEMRVAVDTLLLYCNAIEIRPEILLEPYILKKMEAEESGAIVDPYVIQMAKLMEDCSPETKLAILQAAEIFRQQEKKAAAERIRLLEEISILKANQEF